MKWKQLYQSQVLINEGLISNNRYMFNPHTRVSFNKEAYTTLLTTQDIIMCANRYKWKLPINLTSQQLESLFYQYGSLAMFENKDGEVVFSRYTVVGELTPYGLLNKIQPIDLSGKAYDVVRSVIHSNSQGPLNYGDNVAIIINDYTSLTQITNEISRAVINATTTINDEVTVYNQMINNVNLSIKKAIALCDNIDQVNTILKQVNSLLDPNEFIVPIVTSKDKKGNSGMDTPVEMFNFNNNFETQNYCQTIEFYNKKRRTFNGVPCPDTFEKKERKITSESEDTNTHTNIILLDGLLQRQNGLELFKKYCKNPVNKTISVDICEALKETYTLENNVNNEDEGVDNE